MNQVRASHILVATEQRALELRDLLEQGASFEQLAAAHSTCPSGKDGGDLGWFAPGMMVREFEDVAFAMDEGEIAGPIRTGFGWHLIRIDGVKHPHLRVLVTSDLHFDLTGPEPLRRLVAGMDRENPDLVILGGDLGNPARHFGECLRAFVKLNCPVAVIPGNHDLWAAPGEPSLLLYEELLPALTREYGFHWLERDPLVLPNGSAICGTIGWYDYSARDRKLDQSSDEIRADKRHHMMDAARHDWEFQDEEFAERCRNRLCGQLEKLEADEKVRRVLAVTHVPCFATQLEQYSEDEDWRRSAPYFGHLTLGERLMNFGKVRWVVSGHTHIGLNGVVERPGKAPLATAVIPSDYGKPRWVTLEV